MANDPRKWARKSSQWTRKQKPDPFEEFMLTVSNAPPGVPGGYIVCGNREIYPDDDLWPGDEVAARITRLYNKLVLAGKPKRYERKVAALLGLPVHREPAAIRVEDKPEIRPRKRNGHDSNTSR